MPSLDSDSIVLQAQKEGLFPGLVVVDKAFYTGKCRSAILNPKGGEFCLLACFKTKPYVFLKSDHAQLKQVLCFNVFEWSFKFASKHSKALFFCLKPPDLGPKTFSLPHEIACTPQHYVIDRELQGCLFYLSLHNYSTIFRNSIVSFRNQNPSVAFQI